MAALLAAFANTPLGQQAQQQQHMIQPLIAPLNEVITNEDVQPLLASPEIIQALLPLLPEGQQTEEELRATIRKRGVHCDIQDVLGSNTLNDSYLFFPSLSLSLALFVPSFLFPFRYPAIQIHIAYVGWEGSILCGRFLDSLRLECKKLTLPLFFSFFF